VATITVAGAAGVKVSVAVGVSEGVDEGVSVSTAAVALGSPVIVSLGSTTGGEPCTVGGTPIEAGVCAGDGATGRRHTPSLDAPYNSPRPVGSSTRAISVCPTRPSVICCQVSPPSALRHTSPWDNAA
jgi:hypothetical protein